MFRQIVVIALVLLSVMILAYISASRRVEENTILILTALLEDTPVVYDFQGLEALANLRRKCDDRGCILSPTDRARVVGEILSDWRCIPKRDFAWLQSLGSMRKPVPPISRAEAFSSPDPRLRVVGFWSMKVQQSMAQTGAAEFFVPLDSPPVVCLSRETFQEFLSEELYLYGRHAQEKKFHFESLVM